VQVKTIADAHGISPRFLVQILLQLKGSGLVASSRGAAGGYVLARAPDTISLADVVYCIDPLPRAAALHDLPRSALTDSVREVWQQIGDAERRVLQRLTLADLVERTKTRDLSSYQI
jgi:Rrf2 family protein